MAVAHQRLRTDGTSLERLTGVVDAVDLYLAAILGAAGGPDGWPGSAPTRAGRGVAIGRRAAGDRQLDWIAPAAAGLDWLRSSIDRWLEGPEPSAEDLEHGTFELRRGLAGLEALARHRTVFASRSAAGRHFVHPAHGDRVPFDFVPVRPGGELPLYRMFLLGPTGRWALDLDPWISTAECVECGRDHVWVAERLHHGSLVAREASSGHRRLLDRPSGPGATFDPGLPPVDREPPIDQVVGRYRVVAVARPDVPHSIRLAVDTEHGTPVTLKPFPYGDGDRKASRFERERSVAEAFCHPNLVRVLGTVEGPRARWVVQEYVCGDDLQGVLDREGWLGRVESIDVARQILDGLAVVHEAGWVHRDVKPSNILLSPAGGRDGRWRVRVADFGLARDTARVSALTACGAIIGSCHYMSPEQATGRPAEAASDLYAVGVVLFRALTGRVPFDGETVDRVLRAHVEAEPVAPSSLRPRIGGDLDRFVLRCLAKDPADRFADAAGAARALAALGERRTIPGAG